MDTASELKTPSSDELPELLAEQRASGLTMAAFARERGLTTWKLYSAARRKGGLKPKRKAGKGAASAFAPVAVLGSPSADIELDLGPRGVLRIPAGFDPAALRRLLEVLRSC